MKNRIVLFSCLACLILVDVFAQSNWKRVSPSNWNTKFEILAKGRMIADLIAIIGSIDIVLGEIDR
jgi:NADH:ubiquinone oxidoreductase subunit D